MPQEINTKKLRIMDEDEIVHKSENDAFVKRVLEILLDKDKKHDAKLETLSQAFHQLMSDLRKEVDGLFVSERVAKVESNLADKMKAIDERMTKVRDGRDGKSIKGMKGDRGNDGAPDRPADIKAKLESLREGDRLDASAIKGIEEMVKQHHKEIMGNMRFGRGGGNIGGTPHNLVQIFNATSQADGFKRVFTGLPTARFYPMVFLRGQNPVALAAEVDYTIGNRTITLLNHIEPPASGVGVYVQFIK